MLFEGHVVPEPADKKRYGQCILHEEIGRGAKSIVYRGHHEALQIPVAVKVMVKEPGRTGDQFTARFMREAHIAAELTHTNIVRLFNCGEADDAYFLVFEYIEGDSCGDRLEKDGAFDWKHAAEVIRQVADALRYAHRKGIIHRDLKPDNIMIDNEGTVRLTDLGLAKETVADSPSMTTEGSVLGTPNYMSPEQVRRPDLVDFRSDIYGLGVTFYHMATGSTPFESNSPFEMMAKHVNEPVMPPGERRPGLPEALCEVIMRMMAKAPEERHASYDELIADLDRVLASEPLTAAQQQPSAPADELSAAETVAETAIGEPAAAPLAVAAPEPPKETAAAPEPIRPDKLPVTPDNVRTGLLALLALLAYAFIFVGVHHLLSGLAEGMTGELLAASALAAALLVAVGYSVLMVRGLRLGAEEGMAEALGDRFNFALARICARLDIPTPVIHLRRREDDACRAYSFLSRRASLYVPAGWMQRVALSDAEMSAMLAQGLGGVYTGDSNLRLLLALPVGLLTAGRWLASRIVRLVGRGSPRLSMHVARALALGSVVIGCGIVVGLFFLHVGIGVLGLLFLIMMAAVSAFERNAQCVADAVAAEAVESPNSVRSLLVLAGLEGMAPHRLLQECAGTDLADQWAGESDSARARAKFTEAIATHFSQVEYEPGLLARTQYAFDPVPSVTRRFNRLAGLRADSALTDGVAVVRKLLTGLLGDGEAGTMHMAELASGGFYHALGAGAGALAVLLVATFGLTSAASLHVAYVPVLGLVGIAVGIAVPLRLRRRGISAGRVGWALGATVALFTCAAALGFCLATLSALPTLAPVTAMALVPLLALAALTAAATAHVAGALGLRMQPPSPATGGLTTHTAMLPGTEPDASDTEDGADTVR